MGTTEIPVDRTLLKVQARNGEPCTDADGCRSSDGHVLGTYVHGLFDSPAITRKWLDSIGLQVIPVGEDHGAIARDHAYEELARHALKHLDMQAIIALLPPALREALS